MDKETMQDMDGHVKDLGIYLNELFFDTMQTVETIGFKMDQLAKGMGEVPCDEIVDGYATYMREFKMLSKLMTYVMEDYHELKLDILGLKNGLQEVMDESTKEKA